MAVTAKRLVKTTATTSLTTGYTVPALTTTIVKQITLVNTSGADVAVTVAMAGTNIIDTYVVKAKDSVFIDTTNVLAATETIQVSAVAGSSINVYISGVEIA